MDLIKQDGVFVCQSCDVKYFVEETMQKYVETKRKVDGSGSTITVDKSSEVDNLLIIARRARNGGKTLCLRAFKDQSTEMVKASEDRTEREAL